MAEKSGKGKLITNTFHAHLTLKETQVFYWFHLKEAWGHEVPLVIV